MCRSGRPLAVSERARKQLVLRGVARGRFTTWSTHFPSDSNAYVAVLGITDSEQRSERNRDMRKETRAPEEVVLPKAGTLLERARYPLPESSTLI